MFDDPRELDVLQADMGRVAGTLTPERAKERFRELGIDTVENKDRAVELAKQLYSAAPAYEEVRKKVLAQYFLDYSEHLRIEECLGILASNADAARAEGQEPMRARVYALDVLVIAKVCAREDEEAVARLAEDEEHRTIKAQLLTALEFVRSETEGIQDG